MTDWLTYLEKQKAAGLIRDYAIPEKEKSAPSGKPGKYRNRKTLVDDIEFDSQKEAGRYRYLKWLLKIGQIGFLQWQVEYELNPGGTHSLKYISDFEYVVSRTGEKVVEDVKGYHTREYRKKKRLMKKVHGITIKEV